MPDGDEENPFEKVRDRNMDQIVKVFKKCVFRKGLKLQIRELSGPELYSTCFAAPFGKKDMRSRIAGKKMVGDVPA